MEAMVKLAILCHPFTPVPEADLEDWLELQLNQLRKAAPQGIIRLSRLAQELPSTEIGIGWLIELELPEESVLLERDGLADALADLVTDMRFLGLQPRVLSPHEFSDRFRGLAGSLADPPALVNGRVLEAENDECGPSVDVRRLSARTED